MPREIEIYVGDVNDVEAHVFAYYVESGDEPASDGASVVLHGTLRGPYCETARTLPAVVMFRGVPGSVPPTAEAIVPDPCEWSSELPHLYQADIVAKQGETILAEYHGKIGLRRATRG